ncbi:MAG TPA: hypothetical protein VG895_04185 [Patescibacteria group bacterium]|nr:hypothetical protein [Patescibacteria group bacterium]
MNLKTATFISILITLIISVLTLPYINYKKPTLQINYTKIEINSSNPPKGWAKYDADDFSIYYPADRIEKHVQDGEDHDGFALCFVGDASCSVSEVSVYPTTFSTTTDWQIAYEKANIDATYPQKYLMIIYPNLNFDGNPGIGSIFGQAYKFDGIQNKLDTAVIENKNKVYGITYDSTNPLDIQILSTLKFK